MKNLLITMLAMFLAVSFSFTGCKKEELPVSVKIDEKKMDEAVDKAIDKASEQAKDEATKALKDIDTEAAKKAAKDAAVKAATENADKLKGKLSY